MSGTYAEIFLNAYKRGLLRIIWSTSGFSLGIDSNRKESIPELRDKEFVEYVFSIIKIVIELADGREGQNIPEEDLEVAKVVYECEHDLKNQIIGYRDDENPKVTTAVSAILKLMTENGDDEESRSFEVSSRDIDDIIKTLTALKEKMDSL